MVASRMPAKPGQGGLKGISKAASLLIALGPEKSARILQQMKDHEIEALTIRLAQLQKVPFMLVVGEKEASSGSVALRKRTGGDQGSLSVDEAITEMQRLVRERSLTL